MDRYDWIINISNTESCGEIYRFFGSKDEVKEKLMSLINKDRENDIDNWDYGCESIDEIEAVDNGSGYELFGENVFYNYSIHYTAQELSHVEFI